MAKINENTDPAITTAHTTENLMKTMEQIRSRIAHLFSNPLRVEYEDEDHPVFPTEMLLHMFFGKRPYFYILESQENSYLGFIPTTDVRLLLEVSEYSGFGIFSGKKFNCTVHAPEILDIVKEELNKFADAHGISEVNITKEF